MRKISLLLSLMFCLALISCAAIAQDKTENEENEKKLSQDQIPAAVLKTLQKESDNAKLDDVEKQSDGDKTVYEADVSINGKIYEIRVSDDGTLLSKKLEHGEDEEQKDDQKQTEKK
jgi:hypothetical protein